MMDEIDPQSAELCRSLGATMDLRGLPTLRQLGDFRILREIGQGGMGIVYEAQQESLGRHVALKVLPPTISRNDVFRERFQREARAAARLHHTNIVPVFGVGEDQGVLYYAMQFIQGQSLDTVLDDVKRMRRLATTANPAEQPTLVPEGAEAAHCLLTGKFKTAEPESGTSLAPATICDQVSIQTEAAAPLADSGTHSGLSNLPETRYYRSIAWVGVQAADALAHAHGQAVLHRDIKPSNLLLDIHGTLWITDFGLAKTQDSEDLTHSGEIIGTLRYMPPERFEGKGDARSDIYALGVTLYEMLTLTPPFTGGDRVKLMAQITGDTLPAPPSQATPLLPRDLETIVQKAMARDPAGRYASAGDMAEDLRRFLENRPIKARRNSVAERLARWCRRNPAVACLLAAVFLLLICLTVGSMVAAFRLHAEREAVVAAEADGTEKLYKSLVAQADASRFSHRVGQRFDTLKAVSEAADLVRERHMPPERFDNLRTLAIAALALPDFRTLRTWEGHPHGSGHWTADDQLRSYARVEQNGVISIRRIDTDEVTARLDALRFDDYLRFSPGGRFLADQGQQPRLRVWDLSGARPRLTLDVEKKTAVFHPDGLHMLIVHSNGSLHLHDLEASGQEHLLPEQIRAAEGMLFAPRADRLATIEGGRVQILDGKTFKNLAALPEPQRVLSLAWHPGGNYLAVVCTEHDIHVWDLKKMTRSTILEGCRNAGLSLEFTPDGDRLLSQGFEGTIRLWDWRTGRQVLQRPGNLELRGSIDGRLLIGLDTRLELVELASGREYRSFVQQSQVGKDVSYWNVAVHPRGRLAAVAMSDHTRLFDLQTGDELAALPRGRITLAFDAQGALLTNGSFGLQRWPIQPKAGSDRWQVGPPEILHGGNFVDLACDNKGQVIGQGSHEGAILVRPGKRTMHLGPHFDARHIAISPDGKYAATANHNGTDGVKIWNTETGRLLLRLPFGAGCSALFSPDGSWLSAGGLRGRCMLEVGAWKQRTLEDREEARAFFPDGSFYATIPSQGIIRFLESSTGRELARLEDPDDSPGGAIAFTPDGATMVLSSDFTHALHLWDLRAVRKQLAEMGLDWDAPPFPQAAQRQPATAPLQVTVNLGNRFVDPHILIGFSSFRIALDPFDFEAYLDRGRAYGRRKEAQKALADYSMVLALAPANHKVRGEALFRRSNNYRALNDLARANADLQLLAELDLPLPEELQPAAAQLCNNLAWEFATGPEKERNLQNARTLVQKAVSLDMDGSLYLNTLGVVYYRLGLYTQATDTLERSLREGQGQYDAFDLFFLAMCHAQQGAAGAARSCFDQATRWVKQNSKTIGEHAHWGEELKTFQAEAEELLKKMK